MNLIENEYRYNSSFRKFVDEYCKKHKCTLEDAFLDKYVRQMFWRYTEL